jgi:hypothetical protein
MLSTVSVDGSSISKTKLFAALGLTLSVGSFAALVATTNIRATVAIDLTIFFMILYFKGYY